MNVYEAKEAFTNTVESIIAPLAELGLSTDTRYYFSDRELVEIPETEAERAAVIAAEVRICHPETKDELMFESAVAVEGGEVLNDEIIREATTLRESVSQLREALQNNERVGDAFASIIPPEDVPEVEPARDNKMFYIGGAIVAAVVILVILLIGR